jgi:hypothetical protein
MHTGANIAHCTCLSLPRTPQVLGVDPWDSVLPCLLVLAVVSSRVYIGRTCIPSAVTSCLLALLVVASAAMVRAAYACACGLSQGGPVSVSVNVIVICSLMWCVLWGQSFQRL